MSSREDNLEDKVEEDNDHSHSVHNIPQPGVNRFTHQGVEAGAESQRETLSVGEEGESETEQTEYNPSMNT